MANLFNLIDEPWIPCLFAGATKTREVSIREALTRAPDIRRLVDPSPLVTVSLHRLLLAMLHRVFGPATVTEWHVLWVAGRFDTGRIDAYLDAWRHRFDLLDPEHPFYQTPGLDPAYATTIGKLGFEVSSGNNPLLFDHSNDGQPAAIPAAAAARLLVAQQAFAIGGLITRLPGEPPSAESGHLVKAAVVLALGEDLFRTLVLNLVRINGDTGDPWDFEPREDAPAWEREPPQVETRYPGGYLDLLTWQSRRVLLLPEGDQPLVNRVVIMDGRRFPRGGSPSTWETMVAYAKRERATAGQDPLPPVGFRVERALWRDSVTILERKTNGGKRPRTLEDLATFQWHGYLDASDSVGLAAYGLSSDRAKLFLWRHEELPLPLAYLDDPNLVTALGHGVRAAEDAAERLRGVVRRMAANALAPDGQADPDRVRALVASWAPERTYWPMLDVAFRRFMRELAEQYEPDHVAAAAREDWAGAIRRAAVDAFDRTARALETSSRGYRAAAQARSRFDTLLAHAVSSLRTNELEETTA